MGDNADRADAQYAAKRARGEALVRAWEVNRAADSEAMAWEESADDPYEGSMLAALHVAEAEVRELEDEGTIYAASDRPHDLGLAFWVVACEESECETEGEWS